MSAHREIDVPTVATKARTGEPTRPRDGSAGGWRIPLATAVLLLLVSSAAAAAAVHPPAPTTRVGTLPLSGPAWSKVRTGSTHPPAMTIPMMAYDAADGYVVLFGGELNSTTFKFSNVTWTYQAGAWTKLSTPVAPSPRGDGAMVYDAADGYVLLFSGGAYSHSTGWVTPADTWKFLHGAWTLLHPSASPTGRIFPQATYDRALGAVVIGGGVGSGGNQTDMWTFHGGNWTSITPSSSVLPFNGGGSMAFDPIDHELVYLHTGCFHCPTWVYYGGNWHSLGYTGSTPDGGTPAFTYDPSLRTTVLVTGLPLTAGFVHGNWTNISTTVQPTPGGSPQIAFDVHDGYLLLFGAQGTTWKLK